MYWLDIRQEMAFTENKVLNASNKSSFKYACAVIRRVLQHLFWDETNWSKTIAKSINVFLKCASAIGMCLQKADYLIESRYPFELGHSHHNQTAVR